MPVRLLPPQVSFVSDPCVTIFLLKKIKEPIKLIRKQREAKENSSLTTRGDWCLPCSVRFNFFDCSCLILNFIVGYTTSQTSLRNSACVGHPGFHWEVNSTSRSRVLGHQSLGKLSIYHDIQTQSWRSGRSSFEATGCSYVNYWSQTWERRLSNAYLEKEDQGYRKKSPSKGHVQLLASCIMYKRNKGNVYVREFG